jgi:type IV secretion system protein VirD4
MGTGPEVREPGAGFELLLLAGGAAVLGVGVVTWLGARLAIGVAGTGGTVSGGLIDWLAVATRLGRGRPPTEAWDTLASGLPGPAPYWVCTAAVAFAAISAAVGLVWLWRRVGGPAQRRRFGQRTEAREAARGDVEPLVVKSLHPPTGRMLLGRMLPRGPLLATEDRDRHPLPGRLARRQGNRGSVALIGPTGSGKTALAASALVTWNGPVVAVSVKRDLYDATAAARAAHGDIAMFDPGMATGLASARWSPLQAVTTSSGVLRTGRALAQAIPRSGVTNADYWAKHGEKLLGAFMGVAGLSRLLTAPTGQTPYPAVNMEHIATWVTTMADATDPVINRLLKAGLDRQLAVEVQLIARHASATFVGIAKEDHKIRSSIYSTASLAIDPWLEPSVAHSATDDPRHSYNTDESWERRPQFVDLDWLMAGADDRSNTLYLTASQPEFERLSPVLGGLLADLKDSIHAWDIAGRRLDKPLLILIDEAGQLELGWLPTEVSTIAALGAFFVTCWQNLSQIQHRYGTLADAVLSGHRTKCFFAGVDDLTTTRYLTTLLGSEYVTRLSTSNDVPNVLAGHGYARRSVSRAEQRVDFAPPNTVRQMRPGEAVLLHGTLPPIHLEAVRWWAQKDLAALVPLDADGHPAPPPDLPTCPLGSDQPAPQSALVDEDTLASTLAELPNVRKKAAAAAARAVSSPQLPFDLGTAATSPTATSPTPADEPERVRRRTVCVRCGTILRSGEGELVNQDGRSFAYCYPSCIAPAAATPAPSDSPDSSGGDQAI